MLKKLSCCIVLFLCIGMLLAGCHQDRAASAPTMTPSPTVSPMPKPTLKPTPRPTQRQTHTPEPTPTAVPKPTPTPAPTSKLDPSLDYHPIILIINENPEATEFKYGGVWGGSYEGDWVSIQDFDLPEPYSVFEVEEYSIPLVRGGEMYQMCSIEGFAGTTVGSKPTYMSFASNDTLSISLNPTLPKLEGPGVLVGVSGEWDICPRIAMPVEGTSMYRIDLDNDSIEETAGIEKEVVNDRQDVFRYVLEDQSGCTCFGEVYFFIDEPTEYAGVLFADLNGDGTMEIVTVAWRLTDTYIDFFEYEDGAVKHIFEIFLGD